MSISHLLNQTCDLYPPTIGDDGLPEYAESPTYEDVKCRLDSKSEQRQNADGTVSISDGTLFFGSDATLERDTKAVIGSQSFIIDRIYVERGLAGDVHHYECLCRELTE